MNVLLIDIDSVIPNLALKKCEIYHKERGDNVEKDVMFEPWADKIYVSSVFEWSKDKTSYWKNNDRAIIGGTGWDYRVTLPKEIAEITPKINVGFTTRGCVRTCDFCFVPKMEGRIRPVADLLQLWDGKAKEIMLLDNNILALPQHFRKVCADARANKIKIDFNQGLDLRILYANKSLLTELQTIRHPEYKFAWDLDDDSMVDKLKWLHDNLGRCTVYVFAGFIQYEKILWKLNTLKKIGHNAHLMMHISLRGNKDYADLRDWANVHAVYQSMSFEEFKENKGKIDRTKSERGNRAEKAKEKIVVDNTETLFS